MCNCVFVPVVFVTVLIHWVDFAENNTFFLAPPLGDQPFLATCHLKRQSKSCFKTSSRELKEDSDRTEETLAKRKRMMSCMSLLLCFTLPVHQ